MSYGIENRTFYGSTMSLNTIPNSEKLKQTSLNINRVTNNISDIEGASPFHKYAQFKNKPNLMDSSDIFGTRSSVLHAEKCNKPCYNLRNDDIEGSKPKRTLFTTTRVVDPLNPVYPLPSTKISYVEPLKYLRDSINVGDIQGTKPTKYLKWSIRDSLITSDIEGACADYKPRHRRGRDPARDIMKVDDIIGGEFKTNRVTDPLDPVHIIHDTVIRLDETSKPRALPKARNCVDCRYTTRDILGGEPGWKPSVISKEKRRHYGDTNKTSDIDRAQADSHKPYPSTLRATDPLAPLYRNLDGEPIIDDFGSNPISNNVLPPRVMVVPETDEDKDREIASLKSQIDSLKRTTRRSTPRPPLVPASSRQGLATARSVAASRRSEGSTPRALKLAGATATSSSFASGRSSTAGVDILSSTTPAHSLETTITTSTDIPLSFSGRRNSGSRSSSRGSCRSKRESSSYQDDIASVRDLPATFIGSNRSRTLGCAGGDIISSKNSK